MNSKYYFILDLHSTQSQISLPVSKGDTAREWHISFSDGGKEYLLKDGILAKLEIKRPTGTYIVEFCAVENNTTVVYKFSQNENTAIVDGLHDCSVTLYDAEGAKIASPKFCMVVSTRVVDSDDINLADSDITAIDAMLAAEAARQAAETARVNAEAARSDAELLRANTDTARGSSTAEAIKNANDAADNANNVAATLREKLDNGEFKGEKGEDGKDGIGLPTITEADEGKIVMVADGAYVLGSTDAVVEAAVVDALNTEVDV